jgi:hypothetical protein
MTKAIVSFPENQRKAVAERRIAQKSGGLGFLAAQDAQNALIRKEIVKNLPVSDEVK